MTIEKEAEDCVYPENNPMDAFWKSICDEHPCIGEELESIRFRIAKALQKKQDRIEELEREDQRLRKIIENEGWAIPDGTLRLGLVTAQERIKELESALKEAVDYIPDKKLFDRAKKAIGNDK